MASKQPIHLAADREPWDRQPGETNKQYSRFRVFMELGRTRTLKQAVEILHGVGDDRVSYRTLMQYAYEYRWTERAESNDLAHDQREAQRLITLRNEMYARHRKMAGALQAKAVAALQKIQPENMTALDVVRFIRYGTQIEATALGEPTVITGVTGPGGGPILTDDMSRLTADERRARLLQVSQELARRAGASMVDEDDE
jgi:ribonucleotide reductase beta subunit family protein with ferritin-like domain